MNWDGLKFFLAIAKAGSLSEAASQLNVNHSTVFRRLNALEQDLGVRLFDRRRTGYDLTEAGSDLLAAVEEIEANVLRVERKAAGESEVLAGPVRLTTTASLARDYVAPRLVTFKDQHPDITIDISVADSDFDLARREADLALRATPAPPDFLVGRRILGLPWFIHGSNGYLKGAGTPTEMKALKGHRVIGGSAELRRLAPLEWLERHMGSTIVARAGDLTTMASMAANGLALAVLPADQKMPGLKRLFPFKPAYASELWLLMHPDMRRVGRIKAVWEFLFSELSKDPHLNS